MFRSAEELAIHFDKIRRVKMSHYHAQTLDRIFPSVWVFSLHSSFPERSPPYSNGRNILDARHLVSEIRVAARGAVMRFVVLVTIDLRTLRNSICPFGICRCYLDYVDATVIFA